MTLNGILLGVDGGGTNTVAALATVDNANDVTIIGKGRAGPSNISSKSGPFVLANIEQAVLSAFDDAGVAKQKVDAACLAMAGADRVVEKQRIQDWATNWQLARSIHVVNDAIPLLYANCEDGVGIGLICGTGSFAFGRNAAGKTARCGGWGYLLGDEGSGYWIAIEAIRSGVRYADGRGEKTDLLKRCLDHFQLADSSNIIPHLYSQSTRADLAQFSVAVFESAEQGDVVANEIIHRAANELWQQISGVQKKLLFEDPIKIRATGGVILNQVRMQQLIQTNISKDRSKCFELDLISDPVIGAIRFAVSASENR